MTEMKKKRKKELDIELKLLSSNNLKILKKALISITSFFLIEDRLNKNIQSYDSIDELWEAYQDELEKYSHQFILKNTEIDNLHFKKLMHYSAHVFRQKGLQNLCDDTLNSNFFFEIFS